MALDEQALAKLAALRDEDFSSEKEQGREEQNSTEELESLVFEALSVEVGTVSKQDVLADINLSEIQRYAVVARVEGEGYQAKDGDVDAAKTVRDLIEAFSKG